MGIYMVNILVKFQNILSRTRGLRGNTDTMKSFIVKVKTKG